MIVLDDRAGSYETSEQFEHAVEFVASVASAALSVDQPTRVSGLGGEWASSNGGDDLPRVLEKLAEVSTQSESDLEEGVRSAASRSRSTSLFVIVTGGHASSSNMADAIALVHKAKNRLIIRATDRPASAEDLIPAATVVNASNGKELVEQWSQIVA